MQTCSKCNASSPDSSKNCQQCNSELVEFSTLSVSLKRLRENPRVRAIRVTVSADGCSHCYGAMKTYEKDDVPVLPHPGCSKENGCRCFYEPVLSETAILGKLVQ